MYQLYRVYTIYLSDQPIISSTHYNQYLYLFQQTILPKGVNSLKVLAEYPIIVVLMYQLYKQSVHNVVADFIPLIMSTITLQPTAQARWVSIRDVTFYWWKVNCEYVLKIVVLKLPCASKNMTLTTMHAGHCDWSENPCLPACVRLTVILLRLAACQTVLNTFSNYFPLIITFSLEFFLLG